MVLSPDIFADRAVIKYKKSFFSLLFLNKRRETPHDSNLRIRLGLMSGLPLNPEYVPGR